MALGQHGNKLGGIEKKFHGCVQIPITKITKSTRQSWVTLLKFLVATYVPCPTAQLWEPACPWRLPYLIAQQIAISAFQALTVQLIADDWLGQALQEKQQGFCYGVIAANWPVRVKEKKIVAKGGHPILTPCSKYQATGNLKLLIRITHW